MEKIIRGSGFTASERYLQRLSDSTFLKLWTYPNTFSDRNKRGGGDGKEICDLLVLCGDDVLVFSDKSIEWPDGANDVIRWARWYRRAIKKSVDQIRGAERWLREYPDRVFLDAACTRRLPISLPPIETRRVHGIAIVRGARDACSHYFDGDEGSLVIKPVLKGDGHIDSVAPGWQPFAIGDVDPGGPFVHVFDEAALDSVMNELDTVTDFTAYLAARTDAIRNEDLELCAGEPDLLASYMKTENPADRRQFIKKLGSAPNGPQKVALFPGGYEDFVNSHAYARKKRADEDSYAWDVLISSFIKHLMDGSAVLMSGDEPSARHVEPALRIMAQENRLRRRLLGAAFTGTLHESTLRPEERFARVALFEDDGSGREVGYVFMTLAYPNFGLKGGYEQYRRVRSWMLETYCYAVLAENRWLKRVVGISMDTPERTPGDSQDLLYLDARDWTPELEERLAERRALYGILDPVTVKLRHETGWEYPPAPISRQQRRAAERRAAKEARRKGNLR